MQYMNIWDVALGISVLPGIDQGGALVSGDLLLSYQPPIPVKLTALLTPLQIGVQDGTFATTSAGFMASISTRFFEAGFGIGVQALSQGDTGDAVLYQTVRLGAENGLMVKLLNIFLHGTDDTGDEGFVLESMQWQMRIPVVSKVSILLQWGGGGFEGDAEWFRVTAGAVLMLRGTGGPGTVSVPLGIGGGFFDYWGDCDDGDCSLSFVGPVISTGLEARF